MPAIVKAVAQLTRLSGVPADNVNNDFYFLLSGSTNIPSSMADLLSTVLQSVYNTVHTPGTVDIASSISTVISRAANACKFNFYAINAADTPPWDWGSPQQIRSWTLDPAASGVNNLPGEVACALSYHGDLTDIPETQANPTPPPAFFRPAARRRGRLYFGPLNTQALSQVSPNFEPFPNVLLSNALLGAGAYLMANEPSGSSWVVASQTAGDTHDVTGGWVDNAFDSQRRRGNERTAKTTF